MWQINTWDSNAVSIVDYSDLCFADLKVLFGEVHSLEEEVDLGGEI